MNSVSISGRVTRDLELRKTQSGTSVCSFSVAVDRPRVQDTTDFFDCVAWRNNAEFACKYFRKGDPIELTGVLTTREYEDREGKKRKAVEIVCDNISFPKQKKNAEAAPTTNMAEPPEFKEEEADDGELPF